MGHLQRIVDNAAAGYAYGGGYWWWGGWWWVWAIIAFFFLVIIVAAAGGYGDYGSYYWGRVRGSRTTPLGGRTGYGAGPGSGAGTTPDAGSDFGLAWLWILIIFLICLAFFGGGHWWSGGY
jgi:uncharacterized membrane protein YhaH (DUF805 family)